MLDAPALKGVLTAFAPTIVYHLAARTDRLDTPRRLHAVHTGHDHIGKQQIDRGWISPTGFKRFEAVGR